MPDRRLTDAFAGVAEAIFPPGEVRMSHAVKQAIAEDGTVLRPAIRESVPWSARDFVNYGNLPQTHGVGGIFEYPQGGRLRRVYVNATQAPTSTLVFEVMWDGQGGTKRHSISMPSGTNWVGVNFNDEIEPGSRLYINVLQAAGAGNVTFTVFTSGA